MLDVRGFAVTDAKSMLAPFSFQRREVGDQDVLIEIDYCGVCHSDIHQVRNEWGGSLYPIVPGHEIVGHVTKIGTKVSHFKVGDLAGIGCFVDSCRTCPSCKEGLEQYCQGHVSATYNGTEQDKKTPTFGGYSSHIVADENYVLKVPRNLELSRVAPLLCAGITTYSPFREWKVGKGQKVGVVGLGGLGHMAVKFAAAFGAEVTVLSTSRKKEADAKGLGAHHFVTTTEPNALKNLGEQFDYIIDTVSAPHDLNQELGLLKRDGTLTLVGIPPKPPEIAATSLIMRRRRLTGSVIGGIKETQEMLDYCAKNEIVSDVELIPIQNVNGAYERMLRGDVRYRFVIDLKSL